MPTIGFIGAGNMAEALIKGIIEAKVYNPSDIFIADVLVERLLELVKKYSVVSVDENKILVEKADIIVLSVKPQNIPDVLKGIILAIDNQKLVISIAAGIKISKITALLGDIPIIRVMPNTPALIGQAASALYPNALAKPHLHDAMTIFSVVGSAVMVENEDLIDAVTAVSGSGPAYFFFLMEEMIKAGIELGLPETVAKDLVLQTAKGAGILAFEADKSNQSPEILRQKVTSPGGTTEAAIKSFKEAGFEQIVYKAIKSACDRSIELSK